MTFSSRGRPVRALASTAGFLVLLTAGCDAGTTPAPVGEGALEEPAATAVAAPAAGNTTTPLGWKTPAYAALGCATRAGWVADGLPADAWDAATVQTTFVDEVAALAGTYWVSADPEGAGYTRFRTEDGEITELASICTP